MKLSINWLLVFIPVSVVLEHAGNVAHPVIFFSAALAILPIAALIERSTEQVARRTGDAIGGLLNATFGNAPELIIALVALKAGYLDMVRASIIGAILANLLLALGAAFLIGGVRHHDQTYNANASRVYSTMMLLAAMSLAVPSAFSRYFADEAMRQEQMLNLGVAGVLLFAYVLYLFFSLKTHPATFASATGGHDSAHGGGETWSMQRALGSLVGASVLAAWMSEILVGAAEGTGQALGMSQLFIGIVFLAIVGGAAESGSAIAMGARNKVDLSVGIALGSSIQIALFVAPMLVFASYFIAPQPLQLAFGRAEVGSLFIGVLIGTIVCGDGRTNWFKGAQLIMVYLIFAMMFYFMPQPNP
ncbi:MAG TPA: calcium/proton exchanger [Povalibacter sp.]